MQRFLAVRSSGTSVPVLFVARATLVALGVAAMSALPCAAQSYLAEVPDPARVTSAYDGPDSLDRTARQIAAIRVIRMALLNLSWDRAARDSESGRAGADETPEEHRLNETYRNAEALVRHPVFDKAATRRLGAASPQRQWSNLITKYAKDTLFRNDVFRRFFTPAWISTYAAAQTRLTTRASGGDSADVEEQFHGAPVPPSEAHFAKAVWDWCSEPHGNELNELVAVQARKERLQRLTSLVRSVGPVTAWAGVLEKIQAEDGGGAVVISIDTVSSYESRFARGPVSVSARVTSGTPIYTAASQLQEGQRVTFSGHGLAPVTQFAVENDASDEACHLNLEIVLTALQAAPQ